MEYSIEGPIWISTTIGHFWNQTSFEEPTNPSTRTQQQFNELKENNKKDKKALFFIFQAVDGVVFEIISSVVSAKQPLNILYTSYKWEDKVKTVRL